MNTPQHREVGSIPSHPPGHAHAHDGNGVFYCVALAPVEAERGLGCGGGFVSAWFGAFAFPRVVVKPGQPSKTPFFDRPWHP